MVTVTVRTIQRHSGEKDWDISLLSEEPKPTAIHSHIYILEAEGIQEPREGGDEF